MSTGIGQERSGEQNRLILRPSLCGAETYPAPPRRARRRRRTSATRAAKKTTGLQAATPGKRKQPVCKLQPRAEDKQAGKTLRRKIFLQARSEGRKATRLGGIRQKWAGDGSAPQARSAHPQRIAASRKQEARALPRLSGRRAAPRVSIRSFGRRQTRATWWNLRPVPSSRRCRLRAAPQCAGKCTVRGRSLCCPWWRKTDRKSSSGSLR